jgi:hypothetical protein
VDSTVVEAADDDVFETIDADGWQQRATSLGILILKTIEDVRLMSLNACES